MTRKARLECFFDCSSPWTYLGFHNVLPMAERLGVAIEWKPVIVGGIFNEVNKEVYTVRASDTPKRRYADKDLRDWTRHAGLVINFPPACGHPVNAVKCMRGCIAMQRVGKLVPFARAAFEALWIHGRDLAQDEVLADLCRAVGEAPEPFLVAVVSPELKAALRENTEEAIRRGAFGSPTFFVDGEDMYFGNDRLVLVEEALRRSLAV